MIYFAYDGSINGDWVSRYAIRLAAATATRQLCLLHIRGEEELQQTTVDAGIERIRRECNEEKVELEVVEHELQGSVAATLQQMLPATPPEDALLVLGTRVRPRQRRYLAGTVADAMLRQRHLDTLAVRVVHPGLLGVPHTLLFSLTGSAGERENNCRLLALLAPNLRRLHLLFLLPVRSLWQRLFGHRDGEALRRQGQVYVDACENELTSHLQLSPHAIDVRVRFSEHMAIDLVIHARKHKSQLICLAYDGSRQELQLIERLLKEAPCDVAVFGPRD